MKRSILGALGLTTLLATPVMAHTGLEATSGFSAGIGHPVGGLDHILAMIAVGILAAQMAAHSENKRMLWAVPLTFVALMGVGGLLGIMDIPVPFVEQGIVGSVIILGAVIAWGKIMPQAVAMALVGVLAIFHGHAHGTEMPMNASGLEYAAGFLLATAVLHGVGIGLTIAVQKALTRWEGLPARIGGGAIALGGLGLAVS